MDIQESRRRIEVLMQWRILEETFEVVEEETCTWVAEVETTHLSQNVSFFIIVRGYNHFIIEKRWRHILGAWFGNYL